MLGNNSFFSKLKGIRLAACPPATQSIPLNLKNRQKCIDEANYGPLNPAQPNEAYWKAKARMFNDSVEDAKSARCGNCAAFMQTKEILDCIASAIGGNEAWDVVEAGDLGYCEFYDFKCAASRTCDAWVAKTELADEDPCWPGYTQYGTKDEGGREVPNCIPDEKE